MIQYDLPTSVVLHGVSHPIRSDYRAVLDIFSALSAPELSGQEKVMVTLDIFYPELEKIPKSQYKEALGECFAFINCGETDEQQQKSPKLVDWEQDFSYMVSPINRVIGKEIRAVDYLHWWTFLSAYYEIGECTFSQIVRIRNLKAQGKTLGKEDREWYRKNRHLVDFKTTFTAEENKLLDAWTNQGTERQSESHT